MVKLAAEPAEYLPNFYGGMHDGINGSDDTDRLLVRWALTGPGVAHAASGAGAPHAQLEPAVVALSSTDAGAPLLGSTNATLLRVAVPTDIERMRAAEPALAREWRVAVRDVLGALIASGARVSGFDRDGWYCLTRDIAEPNGHHGSQTMKLTGVELRRVRMPLLAPFRTSFGAESVRDILLLRVVTTDGEGWAECVALSEPAYSSEYVDAAADVLRRFFVPALARLDRIDATEVAPALAGFRGHRMAKAALETGVLDAELRVQGRTLARELGATRNRVPCGVSVGIMDSVPELLDEVAGFLDDGYLRIKLKIEPGWDVDPVRAVRERFGDALLLQVDANAAYTRADSRHLAKLDAFDLLLIEQPLDEEDVLGHADLAKAVSTPICLDESIVSARAAADALRLGACSIINIKPGRVGGYLEARRIHDLCVAHDIPVWCGGMLETGIGRAANVALAALPGFTLPGDTSASDRYYRTDLTEPFVLEHGHLPVPTAPGLGVSPLPDVLAEVTTSTEWLPA